MSSAARRIRRAAARTGGDFASLASVREAALVLSDVAGPAPEMGQRTPRPTLARWNRTKFAEVDLARVTGILRSAEDGDTVELADLWLRMLKTDAHLLSVWESRIAPVCFARWEITPAEVEAARVEQAKRAADGCREAVARLESLPTIFSALLNARGLGFAVAEIVWGRGPLLGVEGHVPIALKPIHSRRFRFSDLFEIGLYDDGRAVRSLESEGWPVTVIRGRGTSLARLPAGKYVTHTPIGIHDYPTATGLVHSVARWWWVKQVVTKYWLSGAEIGGNPRIIGKILQNAAGVTIDELHSALEELSGDGVTVLREGAEIEIHESSAKSSSEVWDTLFRRMDLAMSKAILGSTINVEVDSGGGNRALGESQDAVTIRPRQQQDAAQMWSTLERDLFRWTLAYNPHIFGENAPPPNGRSVIVEERSSIDQLAIDSGYVRVNELRAHYGLPLLPAAVGDRFIAPITRDVGESTSAPDTAPADDPAAAKIAPEPVETEAPEAPPALEAANENVQTSALNGAQVEALVAIVERAIAGTLPREIAIELITTSFPVERAQAERLVPAANAAPVAPIQPLA